MNGPGPARSAARWVWPSALPTWLAGGLALIAWVACGPAAEPAEGQLSRVTWVPAPGSPPWPRAEVVERLDLLDPQRPWRFEAPTVRKGVRPMKRPTALPVVQMLTPVGGAGMQAHLDGPIDPTTFNELRLMIDAGGPGDVGAELWRGDQLVGLTLRSQLLNAGEPRPVVLELPAELSARGACDRLTLDISNSARAVGLRHVELVRRPVEAWLPDPAGEPGLVAIGGDARRAVGVSSQSPLTARVEVPAGGRLSLSYGQPLVCRRRQVTTTLVISARAGDEQVSRRLALDEVGLDLPVWRHAELDLGALAGRRAELSVTVEASDGRPTAAALAESHLWVPDPRPPTVVLITSDTHRYDHLGTALDGVEVSTPVLDGLAARGVLFDDCFSVTNVTNPSHAALLTGVHPRDLGVLRNNLPLNDRARTLANAFAEAGYLTQAVLSARHLGPRTSGLGAGFDRVSWPEAQGERLADEAVGLALAGLEDAGQRPVFLWLHCFDVHGPYAPPPAYRRLYWPDDRDPFDPALPAPSLDPSVLPEHLAGLRDLAWPEAAYRGEVSWLDAQLGELLERPRLEDAVLAFTADHGESFGAHDVWYGHAGLYPDSVHVPLVLAFPGAPAGRRVEAPVSHLDLAATLADLAGLPAGRVPGRSFAALARGEDRAPREAPRFGLAAHGFSASVQDGDWLLILHLRDQHQRKKTRSDGRHEVELYDLSRDPRCEQDLSGQELARARQLRQRLIDWLGEVRDPGWSGELVDDPEVLEQLLQLGYLAAGEAGQRLLWEPDDCAACQPFQETDR